jgi:hypothetical protein
MLNPHIPSRNEENAQKLKQNEFFASHARVVSVAPRRPQTDLCTFCDYWDKVHGGCLIKRLNGEACPYTGRRWNFSVHIAPEVEAV